MLNLLPEDALKDLLSQRDLSKTDKLMLILAVDSGNAKEVKEIKRIAHRSGLRAISKWNVSSLLSRAKEMAVRTSKGWELTSAGVKHVSMLAGSLMGAPAPKVAATLRAHLTHLKNADTAKFVEEAIACYEARLYRAAVVLSWIGAISLLYDYVCKNKLNEFNEESIKRNAKWKPAKTKDDLARMKESEFLNVTEAISVVGKSVKQELEGCLRLRNGCGHPNSLKLAENRVAGHIESLILNVFSKYV